MTKKKYDSINDFLNDQSFKNWAKDKNLTDTNFWENWLANNPDKKELMFEARDYLIGIQFQRIVPILSESERSWDFFEKTLKEKQSLTKENKKKPTYFTPLKIAASIVILLSISVYFFINQPTRVTHSTGFGEILSLKLKDGSTVTLNANSSISYYNNQNRKVWLDGEAFFEVDKKKTTQAKFWVITKDLTVEVYGTSFNVNTKREKTAVFLEEGKVWLELKNGKTKKMIPGNYISYSHKKDSILEQKELINATLQTSWKNSTTLVFDKMLLKDAMQKVEETYGVKVIFKDDVSKNKIITGGVPITNLDICIKAIEKSVNVDIRKENQQLIIQNKK